MDSSKYYSLTDLLNIIGEETYCTIVLREYEPRIRGKSTREMTIGKEPKDTDDGKKKRV